MGWFKNNLLSNEYNYGGWDIKGVYSLFNSTTRENYARLNGIVRITERAGYGKVAVFTLDGGKNITYIPMATYGEKNVNDVIQLEDCCVVIMSKYGEDDIYRIIERDGVNNVDNSQSRIDIFEHVIIYDTTEKEISRRSINQAELSQLNTYIPGIVVDNGRGGYSCKLFAKGSTTQFYYRAIAPDSDVCEGDMFDIMKCEVRGYRKDHSAAVNIKLFIPTEAKDLSRIASLTKQEEERRKKEAIRKQEQIQTDAKQTISRIQKFIESNDVEVETIKKEYLHLCSLIGIVKAAEYKSYVDKAIERVIERTGKEEEKKRFEEKQRIRDNILKKRELYTSVGYWIIIWIIALLLYLTGGKECSVGILKFFAWLGPVPLLLLFYIVFKCPPYHYDIKSVWTIRLLILLWIFHVAICIIAGYNGFI